MAFLPIDILSAYVLCGAGALVGAVMLHLASSPHAQAAAALRLCTIAFAVLGVGLTHIVFAGPVLAPVHQWGMAVGTLAGLVLVAFGLGRLAGETPPPRLLPALLALALAVPSIGWLFGVPIMIKAFVVAMAAASLLALVMVRRFLHAPPNPAARMIGWSMGVLAVTSLARLAWTLADGGPPQPHMLQVPAVVQPAYALLYGAMPMLVATLLLDSVNAQLRDQLHERATFDELTGLLNRRALRERAPALLTATRGQRREMAVLMIDLDRFKAINDRWGHGVGDLALRHAAVALQQALRPDTLLGRYGGEEFVALVPVEGLRTARLIAERLRTGIEQAPLEGAAPLPLTLTASVGVSLVAGDESLDQALQRADEALYRAKRDGRNQVQMGLRAA